MKYLCFALACIASVAPCVGQEVAWAKNIILNGSVRGMFADRNDRLFLYGHLGAHQGSFITRFGENAALLSEVQWQGPIVLLDLAYDGSSSLYACGYFRQVVAVGAHTITAVGEEDLFVARLDLEGNVKWLRGWGGVDNDRANCICIGPNGDRLLVSGFTYAMDEPYMLITEFDLQGDLTQHRQIDFSPQKSWKNEGYEVAVADNGGYLLLGYRDGRNWSVDGPEPESGHYIFRLDPKLDILWSRFVIGDGCYYGYSCDIFRCGGGRSYVQSFCSSKYCGATTLQRIDASSGDTLWSASGWDFLLNDISVADGGAYTIGMEEWKCCPCPDNDLGYGTLNYYDENNNKHRLTRGYHHLYQKIASGRNGRQFVLGSCSEPQFVVGKWVLEQGMFLFAVDNRVTGRREAAERILASVYPNPSQGKIFIGCEAEIARVCVTDLRGAIVADAFPAHNSHVITGLPAGFYLVTITTALATETRKVAVVAQ